MNTEMNTVIERVHADHAVTKRLGSWTAADRLEVRARKGVVVLDLRGAEVPGEVEVRVDLRRAVLTLLVPEDAAIEEWDLLRTGRGRTKDHAAPVSAPASLIRLVGAASDSEIRVRRGGVAQLTAMLSREYLQDVRRAYREGGLPTIDDPRR
ncbi:hypothetical protein GCM10009530_77840 [Microbispora corallina]|uniref:SCP2 domain-containing protein n=1 Tax=Microbispora corallina TaxID=83302 RepID=A0ABQ4GCD8_9ACTN|nr:hypothetical protein [Microbispora corallina]GIH44710.1 hypothetical protein Mco01_77100 [Microbispora corallina]